MAHQSKDVRSSKVYVECKCPMCECEYEKRAHYTGRLPYRRYCDLCKNRVPNVDERTYRMLTPESNARMY